jgi:predicted  nucleic acid-binding Zn-ribbon protein
MRGHICDRCGALYINGKPNHRNYLCPDCFLGSFTPLERRHIIETGQYIGKYI